MEELERRKQTIHLQEVVSNESKKFLSANKRLFMNCFALTTLPSPPNIPLKESMKIQNYSERGRYYKIANELLKLKKIIQADPENSLYYTRTVLVAVNI